MTKQAPIAVKCLYSLLSIWFTGWLVACSADPAPALTGSDYDMVDTLYLMQIDTLRPSLDSLCARQYEADVTRATDSLIRVRMVKRVPPSQQ